MTFQPGQTVTARHAMYGEVVGQVLSVRPSSWFTGRDIVAVDVAELQTHINVLDDQCFLILTPEASMTAADPSKPARKSSKTAVAIALSTPVDFKEMAAKTREKMQARPKKASAPAADADLPFPVTEAQLDAATVPALQEHAIALPELPGTPVLISPVDVPLGTLGLHAVPLHQTARSGCNVRHHYAQDAIEELADSLKAEGQIENATGRWNAQGEVEIVAGESRRRAQLLREERGESGLTLLVNIRELSDGDALAISATENMRRRSMTALEECEAMQRLQEAGRSVEEITAMFGFKSQQPVADRILVAKNLHTEGRDRLDGGELSLAKAFVIARAPGDDLQKSMLRESTYRSATELSKQLTSGQFLLRHAAFNVEKSGLVVKRDLFDTFEPYFENKAKALNAQLAHAKELADRRLKKGEWAFVDVESCKGWWSAYGHKKYDGTTPKGGGLVITVDTDTGELQERKDIRRRGGVVTEGIEKEEREISGAGYIAAHELRAVALRSALQGDTHRALALTVHALVIQCDQEVGRAHVHAMLAHGAQPPALLAELEVLGAEMRDGIGWSASEAVVTVPTLRGVDGRVAGKDESVALYDYLVQLGHAQLLSMLTTLVASGIYAHSTYDVKRAPAGLFLRLAAETNAHLHLAQAFTLTDEWLKRYPRHELIALAEEAGLGRALVEDCATLKEMRARILEHAARLHAEGFVPKLVRFPDPPTPAAEQTAAETERSA